MAPDPLRLRTGQKLGRYELLLPVARGGVGQVWAARLRGARGFHKLVAIKTLLSARGDGATERQLLAEACLAAVIQHSNVAQTLELGEHEGTLYLAMEWVDGEPLSSIIECAEQAGGVPLLVAVNWIAQVLRGLQAAHELKDEAGVRRCVVHRDVSPQTILVSYSGTVKIVDFGVARGVNQELPAGRELDPKSAYLAPEQISGGVVDSRSDLFAVGVLLYRLTTGRYPFPGQDAGGALGDSASDEPAIRPSRLKPNYSRTLEAVVLKALERDRDRRWPSAEEMRLALQRGVPQAFELGFDAPLRAFMGDTLGEREARKREALHRAELVVDAGVNDSDSGAPSSSVSSLRAIAVDTGGAARESLPPRPSRLATLRPLLARSVPPLHLRRPLLIAASVAAALAIGVVWLRSAPNASRRAVAAPNAGMVDLSPPRAPSARPLLTAGASSGAGAGAAAPPAVFGAAIPR